MGTNTNQPNTNQQTATQPNWVEIKGKIKAKWGKFAESELESFKDNLHLIVDKVQTTYGMTKDKAELEYAEFKKTLTAKSSATSSFKPN
jgi:uncharacterized protein YjbJ (UPF0337 family)